MQSVSSLDLSDEDFIARFEIAGFGPGDFPHAAHLRMAWIYVRHLGVDRAADRAASGIRAMAEALEEYGDRKSTSIPTLVCSISTSSLVSRRNRFQCFIAYLGFLFRRYFRRVKHQKGIRTELSCDVLNPAHVTV